MTHLIKTLTDLLLQLFNLFIIKSCKEFKGARTLFPIELQSLWRDLNSCWVPGCGYPSMQAQFLLTPGILQESRSHKWYVFGEDLKSKH